MTSIENVHVAKRSPEPLAELCGEGEMSRLLEAVEHVQSKLRGGVIWNVNSTARGGGVAELLYSLVAYARGAGVDCRWAVISGNPAFFVLTKHLHNSLHGFGSASGFDAEARALYEQVSEENATELIAVMMPGDVAILHDPQTAGLAPLLARHGVHVVWRCHIGSEEPSDAARAALGFLAPYLRSAESCIFTRQAYVPKGLELRRVRVITPTIDPLSPKNQPLSPEVGRAILVHAGLIEGPAPKVAPEFHLEDGSLSRVDRSADVIRLGRAPRPDEPLVIQVSRWDRLKDHVGVMRGFAHYIEQGHSARLLLVGPNVNAVADDPEGAEVFNEILDAYRALPHVVRGHVDLVNLPMADAEENAAIVNALQREASVIVQKSLQEGFGLTVTEAMWKGKPVIASRVGGIQDQIEHGVSGLLLDDPRDELTFARLLGQVLSNEAYARKLGAAARKRVQDGFLNLRSLYDYAEVVSDVIDAAEGTDR